MLVLSEKGVVPDGVAKTADFGGEIVNLLETKLECIRDVMIMCVVVVELDRARIHVAILGTPTLGHGLVVLEHRRLKVHVFRAHDQNVLFKTLLRERGEK